MSPSRRGILQTGAVIAVAGAAAPLLAACGDDQTEGAAIEPTSTPAPKGGASAGIVAVADIPADGSVVKIVDDRKIVLTKSAAGQVNAFSAVCTHSGCTVKGVEAGSILCVCHGSLFNPVTGAVVQGPARTPLATIPVQVRNGIVDFA